METVLTSIFTIEMLIKILLKGPKHFFSRPYNVFDFLVVGANVIEIIYELCSGDNLFKPKSLSSPVAKSLKFLRLFRFICELNHWKTGSMLLKEMLSTLKNTFDFIVVIAIFNLLASLYGMQLFAYTVRLEEEKISHDLLNGEIPRINYDTFLQSIMATTLIFLNEEWHLIMFQYIRAFGPKAAIYFIPVILGGTILLMKMFIALFINNFLNSDTIKALINKEPMFKKFKEKLGKGFGMISRNPSFQKVYNLVLNLKSYFRYSNVETQQNEKIFN